jgi:hypothetical protein
MPGLEYNFRRTPIVPALALALACLGAASMIYYHLCWFVPRAAAVQETKGLGGGYSFGNDLYQIWITTREWLNHGRDPYAPDVTRKIQTGLYGRALDPHRPHEPLDQRAFPYPVYVDLLFWPGAQISFRIVRIIATCLLLLFTIASVIFWLRALNWRLQPTWIACTLLLTLGSYATLEGLFAAQLGLLIAFLLSAALYAIRQNHFLIAGILMALATMKPQVSSLVLLYLLVWTGFHKRHSFHIGFFSTLALLFVVSFFRLPLWFESWIRTVLAYRHYNPPPIAIQILGSIFGLNGTGPAALAITLTAVAVACVFGWRNRSADAGSWNFWLTFNGLLAVTAVFVLPGQAVYDQLILLPAVLWLAQHRHHFRTAGPVATLLLVLGGVLLCWSWFASLLLLALRPFLSDSVFYGTWVFALPIRNAASLPVAIVALLGWSSKAKLKPRNYPTSVPVEATIESL